MTKLARCATPVLFRGPSATIDKEPISFAAAYTHLSPTCIPMSRPSRKKCDRDVWQDLTVQGCPFIVTMITVTQYNKPHRQC